MSRFAGLAGELPARSDAVQTAEPTPTGTARRPARAGKKGILGYFSPELSRTLNILAIEEATSLQALMGEAFDLLLRSRGKHPFGER
jgi:hypothetical protein